MNSTLVWSTSNKFPRRKQAMAALTMEGGRSLPCIEFFTPSDGVTFVLLQTLANSHVVPLSVTAAKALLYSSQLLNPRAGALSTRSAAAAPPSKGYHVSQTASLSLCPTDDRPTKERRIFIKFIAPWPSIYLRVDSRVGTTQTLQNGESHFKHIFPLSSGEKITLFTLKIQIHRIYSS